MTPLQGPNSWDLLVGDYLKKFKIGDRISNIHSGREFTITDAQIVSVGPGASLLVYTATQDDFEGHRFNEHYAMHYNKIKQKIEVYHGNGEEE